MPIKIRPLKKNETLARKVTNQYDRLKTTWGRKRRLILAVLILSLVTTGSLSAALFYTRHAEEKAWGLESEAFQLLHDDRGTAEKEEGKRMERLTQAAKQYETLLDTYPSRKASALALYEAGHTYFELEKYDLAEAKYRAFIEKQPSHPLLPLVHLKLGHLYQKKKDAAAAESAMRMAYDKSGEKGVSLNQDQAGFELARMLEQTEKKPEAIEIYKKISTAFGESPWGMEAKARLTLLGESTGSTTPDMPASPQTADSPAPVPATPAAPAVTVPQAVPAAPVATPPAVPVRKPKAVPLPQDKPPMPADAVQSPSAPPDAPEPAKTPALPSSGQSDLNPSEKMEGKGEEAPPVPSAIDTPALPVKPNEAEPSPPAASSGESVTPSDPPHLPSAPSESPPSETPP